MDQAFELREGDKVRLAGAVDTWEVTRCEDDTVWMKRPGILNEVPTFKKLLILVEGRSIHKQGYMAIYAPEYFKENFKADSHGAIGIGSLIYNSPFAVREANQDLPVQTVVKVEWEEIPKRNDQHVGADTEVK